MCETLYFYDNFYLSVYPHAKPCNLSMCLRRLKHINADDRVQAVPSPDGVTISPLDKSSRAVSLVAALALGSDRYLSRSSKSSLTFRYHIYTSTSDFPLKQILQRGALKSVWDFKTTKKRWQQNNCSSSIRTFGRMFLWHQKFVTLRITPCSCVNYENFIASGG